ncbi:MAG: ATPase, T2SS/T4P/T4SS family [archaeon]|nr:ATPase, T2SS/T4P/T4SS family [archaeon]
MAVKVSDDKLLTNFLKSSKTSKVIETYGRIVVRESYPVYLYEVRLPTLSEQEFNASSQLIDVISGRAAYSDLSSGEIKFSASFAREFRDTIIHEIEASQFLSIIPETEDFEKLEAEFISLINGLSFISHKKKFVDFILDNSVGYGFLAPLMGDDFLEEIMVNGFKRPIFVFHKKHGMCKTNLVVQKDGFISNLIKRIAATASKEVVVSSPLLDARLPDGSRANATLQYATPFGPSLTIRKFSRIPLSVINLIENQTMSSEVAAFLWVMVEGFGIEPMNMLICGGSSSGKTTTLNALASFIRYSDRILSIEDTPELDLGKRDNWVEMEAKLQTRDVPEITMDDLLKNSLRMRPDRLILGEVRGKEAQTLFTAMDIGHKGCMGTLHANSGRELLIRLKSAPMNVPEVMLPLLDLIVVQQRRYSKERGLIRRVAEIAEVTRMEDNALLASLYIWDPGKDEVNRNDVPSRVFEELGERVSKTKKDIMREVKVREKILQWMLQKGIKDNNDVDEIIQSYYYDAASLLEKVSLELNIKE